MKEQPDINGNISYPYQTDQQRVGDFVDTLKPPLEAQVTNLKNETVEMLLELPNGVTMEFAKECADVYIGILGLLHSSGIDFSKVFEDKLRDAENKYRLAPFYKARGESHDLAMARCKDLWNERIEQEDIDRELREREAFLDRHYDGEKDPVGEVFGAQRILTFDK